MTEKIPAVETLCELEFVSEYVNKDYFCPVSLEVMRDPHQADCCGHHLSTGVAERLTKEGKPCPMCKASTFTTRRDLYFQRIILDEKVRCLHRVSGCIWIGPLRELQNHSASCTFRPWVCQYCKYSTCYERGTTEHAKSCPERPVLCPCSSDYVPYSELEEHRKVCSMEVIPCEFVDVGCTVKVPRHSISDHMQSSIAQHNLLVSRKTLDIILAMQPSSCGPNAGLSLEASLRKKDTEVMEQQNSAISCSADLDSARKEIVRLQGELELQKTFLNEIMETSGSIVTTILGEIQFKKCLEESEVEKVVSSLKEIASIINISVPEIIIPESPPKVKTFKGFLEKAVANGLSCAGGVAAFGEDLYVVDTQGNYGVRAISKNGTVRNIIKSSSSLSLRFSTEKCCNPKSVALDKKGNIFLSDTGSLRVLKFDPNGNPLAQAGKVRRSTDRFSSPSGIALGTNDKVYVCDQSNHRIVKLTADLQWETSFGRQGKGLMEFVEPCDIAVDSKGNIYVVDQGNCCVKVFTSTFSFLNILGKSSGTKIKDGDLVTPKGVCVDSKGNVYVTDLTLKQALIFDSAGNYSRSFGEFRAPMGICLDNEGRVYVSDKGKYLNPLPMDHCGSVLAFI